MAPSRPPVARPPSPLVLLLLLALSLRCAAALPCDLTGVWRDDTGNWIALAQSAQSAVVATSRNATATGWATAAGSLSADGRTLSLSFGGKLLTARVDAWCSAGWWSNNAAWRRSADPLTIERVHVVFMTHLDVGFTGLARDVCELYFDRHFPAGFALSAALRAAGGAEGYSVTSHPWLILEYLDGTAGCARTPRNSSEVAAMVAAIERGDVRWHGKPMNNFMELEDAPWLASSLQLAKLLNARFNKSWGRVAAHSADIPGMSRSAVPVLAAAGMQSMHIGYNYACRVPDIPQAFVWAHTDTDTQLLTLVNDNYGDLITLPSARDALAFMYSMDNSGPPASAAAVTQWWAATQAQFPNAQLLLSSLDDFTEAVLPAAGTLPVLQGEIGQSWSYGSPADPQKLAAVRAARRLRNAGVAAGWLDAADSDLLAYERRLWVGGPEHNWGLCFGCFLPGGRSTNGNWSNVQFSAVRQRADYQFIESGNVEKRNFTLPLPLGAAPSAGYARYLDELGAAAAQLLPSPPDLAPFAPVSPSAGGTCGRFSSVAFSPATGALTSLVDAATGHQWVAPGGSLGGFTYRTYSEAAFNVWNTEYNARCGAPCGDFAKQGMDSAAPADAVWAPALQQLLLRAGPAPAACTYIAQLRMPDETVVKYGAPASVWLEYAVDADAGSAAPVLSLTLAWQNKTATRLAESAWVSFVPDLGAGADVRAWRMDVLGSPVSPLEVVDMGTRWIHAVGEGVWYDARAQGGAYVKLDTLDAPIVSPGDTAHLLHYDGLAQPDLTQGWHFNVWNNVWVSTAAAQRWCSCVVEEHAFGSTCTPHPAPVAGCRTLLQASAGLPVRPSQAVAAVCAPTRFAAPPPPAPPVPPHATQGTAFPQWNGDDGLARFAVTLEPPKAAAVRAA